MPSKKQFIEIRSPRTEKLGRDSAIGGTVYADFVQDGQRVVLVKMPVKEVSVATKKKSHKKGAGTGSQAAKPAQKLTASDTTGAKDTPAHEVVTRAAEKDSPTSFDTSKMVEQEVK